MKGLSKKSWFPFRENVLFILFEKHHTILMYLISLYKLEYVIRISTFKCDPVLEEADIFKPCDKLVTLFQSEVEALLTTYLP